jgi:hypothetical protein
MVLYAWCVMFVHSRFTENPPIDLEVTHTSFLRWFYHNVLLLHDGNWWGLIPSLSVEMDVSLD